MTENRQSRRLKGHQPEVEGIDYAGRVTPDHLRRQGDDTMANEEEYDTVDDAPPPPQVPNKVKGLQRMVEHRFRQLKDAIARLNNLVNRYNSDPDKEDASRVLADAKIALDTGKSTYKNIMEDKAELEEKIFTGIEDDDVVTAEVAKLEKFFNGVSSAYRTLVVMEDENRAMFSKSGSKYKLPDFKVPTFKDQEEDYHGFRKTIRSILAKQPEIDDATRLAFLRSQLAGQAKETIAMLGNTNADYQSAWSLLDARFGDKTAIKRKLTKKLTNMESLSENAPSEDCRTYHYDIRGLWVKLTEAAPVLAKQDESYRTIVTGLYPYRIRKDVEDLVGEDPSVDEFLEAAGKVVDREVRLRGGNKASRKKEKSHGKGQGKGGSFNAPQDGATAGFVGVADGATGGNKNAAHGGAKKKTGNGGGGSNPSYQNGAGGKAAKGDKVHTCEVCKQEGHFPYKCKKLLDMKAKQREDAAVKANLCFRCLRGGHHGRDCKWARKCTAKDNGKECEMYSHHVLLHRPRESK